jgi:hypothetical protein
MFICAALIDPIEAIYIGRKSCHAFSLPVLPMNSGKWEQRAWHGASA